jgi:hypothetical protein
MNQRRSPVTALVWALNLFLFWAAPAALAQDSYYMMVFSNQRTSNDPRFSHTFATFVKTSGPSASTSQVLEVHTLSWMPASHDIAILRLQPEPGVLYDLESSLAWAYSVNARVSMWGPYEIQEELYERAVAQERKLSAGGLLFKMVDGRFRSELAINCIHAVSDIDTDQGRLHVGPARGDAASHAVAWHLERWIIAPEQTHPWVCELLGLDRYPILRRDW